MSVKVSGYNHFPQLIERLPGAVSAIVRDTGLAVLKEAQENIKRNKQIKTGHMLGSGHIEPIDRFNLWVVFSADYAGFQELGTIHMRARPFLMPAVEHHRRPYEAAFREIGRLVSGA